MTSNNTKTTAYGYNPLELRSFQNFYTYDDELYDKNFPREWAMNHFPRTGPKECHNCSKYGCWRGVFIGYCVNCANHDYKYKRGAGFLAPGGEVSVGGDPDFYAMNSYLKDANFNYIGDIEMHPGHRADNDGKPILSVDDKQCIDLFNTSYTKGLPLFPDIHSLDSISDSFSITIQIEDSDTTSEFNEFYV